MWRGSGREIRRMGFVDGYEGLGGMPMSSGVVLDPVNAGDCICGVMFDVNVGLRVISRWLRATKIQT